MTTRKKSKQPQLMPLPPIETFEEWIEALERLTVMTEEYAANYADADPKFRRIAKELRRVIEILKAPPITQGEQG